MAETTNIQEVVEEIKGADESQLREVIKKWFETTRTAGLKIGASYMSAAIFGVIQKHTKKKNKVSLRDYERMTAEIIQIISVQLKQQNDSEDNETEESE